ncbi:hypothetical protein G7072_18760 [Nocardioides sp. HDW12B]|uniref:hypothetical protein n=1 Tax=Nocardioides sp. HDW12B TaxID=2714939 RepID=UPI0014090736|nr:hypothetical protein [Nocardioides sp. HDW12B]QIK68109.1 hypothetical protein G7072_18760 [Nocardioides sp. HDW12B]
MRNVVIAVVVGALVFLGLMIGADGDAGQVELVLFLLLSALGGVLAVVLTRRGGSAP